VERLDPVQIRVLGCLLEKQQTTPDSYPLTLNALRTACNQATSRDPVVDYDEATVREGAQRLGQRGLARLASYHGSRTTKYRHLVDEALGVSPGERALLCVLMLRGPQTLGELKQRSERLHAFAGLREVEETLDRLTARELGGWLERRPGQKESRYAHLLEDTTSGDARAEPAVVAVTQAAESLDPGAAGREESERADGETDGIAAEVARLRRELADLRDEVTSLREQLGG
jgi:uncharacterized protein YceH (UPF0502 family)